MRPQCLIQSSPATSCVPCVVHPRSIGVTTSGIINTHNAYYLQRWVAQYVVCCISVRVCGCLRRTEEAWWIGRSVKLLGSWRAKSSHWGQWNYFRLLDQMGWLIFWTEFIGIIHVNFLWFYYLSQRLRQPHPFHPHILAPGWPTPGKLRPHAC